MKDRYKRPKMLALILIFAIMFGIQNLTIAQVSINAENFKHDEVFTDFDGNQDPVNWITTDVDATSDWQGQNTGSSTTGGKYSYGNSSSSDRSLGFLPTGDRAINADITFTNNTGITLTEFQILYDAEHWRNANGGRTNGWTVNWYLDSADQGELEDLTYLFEPRAEGTGASTPGPWESVTRSFTVEGVSIANGETITIRFFGDNGTGGGSRQGIAINNFSFRTGTEIETLGATEPIISSVTVSGLTVNSAKLSSEVTDDGDAEVTDRGFVLSETSENNDPLIGGTAVSKIESGTGIGEFSETVTELETETEYSVKSYATNSEGTVYSSVITFTTLPEGIIFLETFGLAPTTRSIAAHDDYDNPGFTFEGDADVRSSLSSSGYDGASGGANVFYTTSGGGERELIISGIDTEGFSKFDFSFGMHSSANQGLSVSYSLDGENYTAIDYDIPSQSGWKLISISGLTIPATDDLSLKFKSDSESYRLDDVTLKRTGYSTTISGNAGWRMLSLPVNNVPVSTLADQNNVQGIPGANNFYGFEEHDHEDTEPNMYYLPDVEIPEGNESSAWTAPADIDYEFTSGQGFIWYFFDNDEFPSVSLGDFTLAVGGVSPTGSVMVTRNSNSDFTLIGNPFATAIDVSDVSGWGDIQETAQIWDPVTENYISGGSFSTAQPFDGFFVESSTGEGSNIEIPEITPESVGSSKGYDIALYLRGENAGGLAVQDGNAKVRFHENATHGWDIYDASKLTPLLSSYASIAFIGERAGEQRMMAIDARPADFSGTIDIPVALNVVNFAGDFSLSAEQLNIPDAWSVYLTDHELGTTINLREEVHQFTFGDDEAASMLSANTHNMPETMLMSAGNADTRFTISISSDGDVVSAPHNAEIPRKLELSQNYPNPFNPSTNIRFALPENQHVTLRVYDTLGRLVSTLVDAPMTAGHHQVRFDASRLTSGVYIYQLHVGSQMLNHKMILIK